MKHYLSLLFLPCLLLSSCVNSSLERRCFCFDTSMDIKLFEGNSDDLDKIEQIFVHYDKLSDNYKSRDVNNVYTINYTNEDVAVDTDLYQLLQASQAVSSLGANHFSMLMGSLSKKWKEALHDNQILSNEIIISELNKIQNSGVIFKDNSVVQRFGEAEIDLGAIAKGYSLDIIKQYLDSKEYKKYLVNAGYSSILLGEKNSDDGYFKIGIRNFDNSYLKLKNCFISTSGVSEQSTTIDGVTYSHIINPSSGSAISNYDTLIVVSSSGYLGDALSTSLLMADLDEIQQVETSCSVQVLAIKDKSIVYKNESLEVFK